MAAEHDEPQVNGDDREDDQESLLERLMRAEGELRRIKDQNAARSRRYRQKLAEKKAEGVEGPPRG